MYLIYLCQTINFIENTNIFCKKIIFQCVFLNMIIIDFDILQSLNSMNYPKNNSYFQHGYFIKRDISLSKFIFNSIFEYIQNLKKKNWHFTISPKLFEMFRISFQNTSLGIVWKSWIFSSKKALAENNKRK